MLAEKKLANGNIAVHKIENSIVTVQLEGEKKRYRTLSPAKDGKDYAFTFKGTTWLLGYDFNLTLDSNGNVMTELQKADNGTIPFFVYGTLRKGMWNHYRLEQAATSIIPAKTKGIMYHNGSYPYVFEDESNEVVGEIVFVKPELYERMIRSLDGLECYYGKNNQDNHYNRQQAECITEGGESIVAWIYFGNLKGLSLQGYVDRRRLVKIKDGDFVRWNKTYR